MATQDPRGAVVRGIADMTVYLIVFWILGMIALLMELRLTRRARLTLFAVSYAVLVVIIGLRWETGNDWPGYYQFYSQLPSPSAEFSNMETGFRLFSTAIKYMGLPFAGFNLIYAAIYLGLIFLSFKRDNFEISGWLVLQLYSPFLFGLMGTTRQVMALAICMFSVHYILSKEPVKFLLCIAFAVSFHISALAFLLAWPIARIRLTFVRVWVVFAAVLLASAFGLGDRVVQVAEDHIAALRVVDLASHLELERESSAQEFQHTAGFSILPTIERVSLLLLFLLCYRSYTEESDQLYLKLFLFSVVIVVLLSGTVYVLAERVSLYFSIFQIYLLALLTRRMNRPVLRQACCAMLLVLSLTRLYTATHAAAPKIFVPYKGVLINRDVRRDMGWF